jgi:hypothetical protein
VELEDEIDAWVGNLGLERLKWYYDTHMESKPYGFTNDIIKDVVLQIEDLWSVIGALGPRKGVEVDLDGFEDDVEPAEEEFVITNAPKFRAMGIARGGVRF